MNRQSLETLDQRVLKGGWILYDRGHSRLMPSPPCTRLTAVTVLIYLF
jgi:hypothetical protein